EGVQIIDDMGTAEVARIRDFLDRMGIPHRVYSPSSEAGRGTLRQVAEKDGNLAPAMPVVAAGVVPQAIAGATARDVARVVYGSPDTVDATKTADPIVIGSPARRRGA